MSRDRADTTRDLLVGTLGTLAVTGAVAAGAAGAGAGAAGARGALVGVGLVAVLFGGSAALLAVVPLRAPGIAIGVLVGGALARMIGYGVVLAALADAAWIHRPSLAIAAGAAVVVTLAYELRALSRMPRLYWVDADVPRTRTVPSATRS